MFWTDLIFSFILLCFMIFMEQLTTLVVQPRDQDLAAKSLATLKVELMEEKAAREKAQAKNKTLAQAVEDLKKTANKFATQIPVLEDKVKHLDNKVLDTLTEARAKELSLERVTKANEDYKNQNTQLTTKLKSKPMFPLLPEFHILLNVLVLLIPF
jgi:chromosome segregation ATPase